ncbi:hypothetical protein CYMTET_54182 [Cymbomonas tetramitiformis]|uniref:Uncharacterized protein n=1 Tax=Cymbomonas tetramitiformis TaxID=36881 RepID=A0AAE0BFL8_9CHLO|nr:hypothetical protein CYMTET_54182 [Cymbomonas tetramitiformis]|eukprot:gene34397-biopygen28607
MKVMLILGGIALDLIDPEYMKWGYCMYASCKRPGSSEVDWHVDQHDVQFQYWTMLGGFTGVKAIFDGEDASDMTRSFFGSRSASEPYTVLIKCNARARHAVHTPDMRGVTYSISWFKMYDSEQLEMPARMGHR